MNYQRLILLHVISPLTIGGLCFLFLRSDSSLHVQLFSPDIHLPLIKTKGTLAGLLKFNLPDFCWCYSLAASLFIWKRWWGVAIPLFPVWVLLILAGSELIQLIPGSAFWFDPIDLLAAIIAFGLSCYFLYRQEVRKNLPI